MPSAAPFPRAVAIFTVLYLLVFGGLALTQGNKEFVFYLAVMLALIGMVYALHMRVAFSTLVLWLLATWGLMHLAGGTVHVPPELVDEGKSPVLYSMRPWDSLPKYDQVTHAFGFFVATLASAEALIAAARPRRISAGFAVACGLMGVGLGALNEVVEFVAVLLLPETNVGGYENTAWDLVSNSIGAAIGAVLVYYRGQGRSEPGH
jgi:uncharacterized membrane protein YjdF